MALLLPAGPAGCDLRVSVLCAELPWPGDAWPTALATPRLALATWLDFAAIAAYVALLGSLGFLRGDRRFGVAVAIGALLAGGCDVAENALLLDALARPDRAGPGWVYFAASTKFAMLGVVTAAVALSAPPGPGRALEGVGALAALGLLATPLAREATLFGAPGLALAWLTAWLRLVLSPRKGRNEAASGRVARP
jgi:hypothetical protein